MRIAQISDIHIGVPGDYPHGIDSRAQFLQVLASVTESRPDVLVISGDLCNRDPDAGVYAWIADQLQNVPCKVLILAGNHDSQKVMSAYLKVPYHAASDEIYASDSWEGQQVFFLDSGRGVMSDEQYKWLEGSLDVNSSRILFFMHHPPIYGGVPHMDARYAFKQIPRFQQILSGLDAEISVFCGHYHVERVIRIGKQSVYITPSTFFQIDAHQIEFAIDHHVPGYRLIELTEQYISSKCIYGAAVKAGG